MSTEEIKLQAKAIPFRPFRLRLTDGQFYDVPTEDHISFSPTNPRTLIVYPESGGTRILDTLLITEIAHDDDDRK